MPSRAEEFGSIAGAIEGLMLIGPAPAEGTIDTWILDWDWESSEMQNYYATASDGHIYGAAACVHDNLLYAAAASSVERNHAVFRAHEVAAPMVEHGSADNTEWRQGSDEPVTITFNPDYSRYFEGVIVDGVDLYGDTEYNVSSGSTVVDLLPEFLSTLAVGDHEMTVYFDGYEDGPGAEVQAEFTVIGGNQPSPTPPGPDTPLVPGGTSAQGYTRPAALAMTGDLLLIVPFAALGIGAVAIGVYLVRRKMRDN